MKEVKIEQKWGQNAKSYQLGSSTTTCTTACIASIEWDLMSAQMNFPFSPQLSTHKTAEQNAGNGRLFSGSHAKLNFICYAPNAQWSHKHSKTPGIPKGTYAV